MMAEPLRSATSVRNGEDTSLALPSDNRLRTGQQRVLDQVQTLKRSSRKSTERKLKNGTWTSPPTSPQNSSVFPEFGTFRFSPTTPNGTFKRSNSTMSAGFNKSVNMQKTRSLSAKAVGARHGSSSNQWDQQFNSRTWPRPPNGLNPSTSEPALAHPLAPAAAPVMRASGQIVQSQQKRQSQISRYSMQSMTTSNVQTVSSPVRLPSQSSNQSQRENKISSVKTTKTVAEKTELDGGLNVANLTLNEAVAFLSRSEESFQQCGASFIQHRTFKEDVPKQEVLKLGGIPTLVGLLQSPNSGVSQSASAALRNLVFRDQANKLEVQRCGGVAGALQLLKETDSTETQKQLTGLLWNLSSSEELKGELIATALPVLTESVVVPFTCWSDNTANNNIHPDVFYSATGCLRNLSGAQEKERRAMRDCRGLVDSLVGYIQSCVAEDNPDDKSVENCVCILHNLTYHLEVECPECFSRFCPPAEKKPPGNKKDSPIGCFSPKSSKLNKENLFDVSKSMRDDGGDPSGVNWLCHPKAMQIYLSLLGTAKRDATLEACCGTLQNLTGNKGPGSSAMSQIMVQKLGALQSVSPLLHSPNHTLQRTAMSLVGNLSRVSSLQTSMARQMLPDLAKLLSSGTREMGDCDETIATACHNARNLLLADTEVSRKVISTELVTSLADLSEEKAFPKASKAASLLLYNLWNEKSLQGPVKKLGLSKSLFVNDTTTAAHKSVQVIE